MVTDPIDNRNPGDDEAYFGPVVQEYLKLLREHGEEAVSNDLREAYSQIISDIENAPRYPVDQEEFSKVPRRLLSMAELIQLSPELAESEAIVEREMALRSESGGDDFITRWEGDWFRDTFNIRVDVEESGCTVTLDIQSINDDTPSNVGDSVTVKWSDDLTVSLHVDADGDYEGYC